MHKHYYIAKYKKCNLPPSMILKYLRHLWVLWPQGHGKAEHFKVVPSMISLVIAQSKSSVGHFSSGVELGPEKGDVPSKTIYFEHPRT